MASLKEIKARIASVNNTLKITSAMKMVASAKLHRMQNVAEGLAAYSERLADIAAALTADSELEFSSPLAEPHEALRRAVVVAVSSDGSLCGAFNTNVIRVMLAEVESLRNQGFEAVEVWPVGEKIAQAAHKVGFEVCDDFRKLASKATSGDAAALAQRLMDRYVSGAIDRVSLVYTHFHSMGHQEPRQEVFLPADFSDLHGAAEPALESTEEQPSRSDVHPDYIYEPDPRTLLEELLPYTLRMRIFEVLLDSATAEHAARMIAMQTATDNAQELLGDLTLTYNKRRQQAITDELADITQVE